MPQPTARRAGANIRGRRLSAVPRPRTDDDTHWRQQGICRDEPDLFFTSARGEGGRQQVARAKAICASCPVLELCREWVLRTDHPDGVWAGTTRDERRALRRQARAA